MAAAQPAWQGDFAALTPHNFIFGPPGPAVQVVGKAAALEELQKAIMVDGLVVSANQPQDSREAAEQSLDFLRLKNAFPTNAELTKLAAQPAKLQLASGIGPEDWVMSETVQHAVYPPFHFEKLNIDFLLALLRVAQMYHNEGRTYQLVILTQMNYGQCHVDMLATVKDAKPTHSIYLYRSFAWEGPGTAVIENWRGFVLRPDARQPRPEVAKPPTYPPYLVERVKRLREKQRALLDDAAGTPDQQTAMNPVDSSSTTPKTLAFRLSTTDHYGHLTDEEILSGAVDPKVISGDLILRLAQHHSNGEIAKRCNSLRKKQNKKDLAVNSYIKRISNALRAIHPTEQAYDEARLAFDAVRRSSGVVVNTTRLAQVNGADVVIGVERKRSMPSTPQSAADVRRVESERGNAGELPKDAIAGSMRKLRTRSATPKSKSESQDEDDEDEYRDAVDSETENEADEFKVESGDEDDGGEYDEMEGMDFDD